MKVKNTTSQIIFRFQLQICERLLERIQRSEDQGDGCPKRLAEQYDYAMERLEEMKQKQNSPCA